jgi:hypothetical protein
MHNDRLIIWIGPLVVLSVIVLAGFVVAQLGRAGPGVIAGVLTALAAVLAAVPPIIKAFRGR